MQLSSSAFADQETIPAKYTCEGENINPPLQISEVPEGTQSLVLIVDDPDAPAGTWDHWIVWNIAPNTTEIAENSVPERAEQGTTSFGQPGYGGPCPPPGPAHRYIFKLYALDATLDLTTGADKSDIEQAMADHILAQTQLIGLYQR